MKYPGGTIQKQQSESQPGDGQLKESHSALVGSNQHKQESGATVEHNFDLDIDEVTCTTSSISTKRDGQNGKGSVTLPKKIDKRAIENLKKMMKAKECQYNILIN